MSKLTRQRQRELWKSVLRAKLGPESERPRTKKQRKRLMHARIQLGLEPKPRTREQMLAHVESLNEKSARKPKRWNA